jgi:hypothetical protein
MYTIWTFWGSKSRVVPTSFGALKMAAFETPLPTFADWGKGQCGLEGWCLIALDPRYAETIAQYGQPAWLLTDCDGTGHIWAENCGQYAIIHGAPRQQFVWLCIAAQRGYEAAMPTAVTAATLPVIRQALSWPPAPPPVRRMKAPPPQTTC